MALKQINYYVINKYTKDIVYPYANGEEDRYRKTDKGVLHIHKGSEGQTIERLLTEQEFPLSEFDRIKKISDEDYCERNKGDVLERRHTVPLSSLDVERCSQVLSAEDTYFNTLYKDDECNEYLRMIKNARGIINECLTGVQKRRLIMYYCKGLSLEEIAAKEGIYWTSVRESIDSAIKKIKKFSNNISKTPAKNAKKLYISEGQEKRTQTKPLVNLEN